MEKEFQRWTARRKVELLLELIKGDAKLVDVCREHDLKRHRRLSTPLRRRRCRASDRWKPIPDRCAMSPLTGTRRFASSSVVSSRWRRRSRTRRRGRAHARIRGLEEQIEELTRARDAAVELATLLQAMRTFRYTKTVRTLYGRLRQLLGLSAPVTRPPWLAPREG
jgi:hypothetical protein